MSRILPLLLLALLLVGSAQAFVRHDPVPGGVALVPLSAESERAVQILFGDRPVLASFFDGELRAVVGIPLDANPGEHRVVVTMDDGRARSYFLKFCPRSIPLSASPCPMIAQYASPRRIWPAFIGSGHRFWRPLQRALTHGM